MRAVVAAGLVVAAFGVMPAAATERAAGQAEARPLPLTEECVTRAERRGVVRFSAPDGARLVGVLLGSGRRVVVLAHQGGGGAPGNLCAWIPYARILRRAGYRVLVFDHRGFGSSPYIIRRSSRVDLDVIGAVKLVRSRGAEEVILGGASLGGAAVVAAAAAIEPSVTGVFTVGATHTYENVDALAAARRLTVPVLFVAAARDDAGRFAQEAREMYAAAPSTDKRVVIYPGSPHGAPQLRSRRPRGLVTGWIARRFSRVRVSPAGPPRGLGLAGAFPGVLSDWQSPVHDGRVPSRPRQALPPSHVRALQLRVRCSPKAVLCRRRGQPGRIRASAPER